MTLGDINSKITFFTGADTTTAGFSTADRVTSINNYKDRAVTKILQSMDDWDFDDYTITTTYPIAQRNIVANQQDYKFSSASWALLGVEGGADGSNAAIRPLKIKRVEVSYDGGTTWYKAEPLDISQRSNDSTQTTINNLFQTSKPYYDMAYNSLFLYPVPTVNGTKCLKVWFDRSATDYISSDLTNGTLIPAFDPSFHMILAYGPSYEFCMANEKGSQDDYKKELEQLMAEMGIFYGNKDLDRNWQLKAEPTIYN